MADLLNMKLCGKCFFDPPCLLCVSAEKDICRPERVYRMRIDPKYPLRRGPDHKIDTRGEDVNFAKRLKDGSINDNSKSRGPKRKLKKKSHLDVLISREGHGFQLVRSK